MDSKLVVDYWDNWDIPFPPAFDALANGGVRAIYGLIDALEDHQSGVRLLAAETLTKLVEPKWREYFKEDIYRLKELIETVLSNEDSGPLETKGLTSGCSRRFSAALCNVAVLHR